MGKLSNKIQKLRDEFNAESNAFLHSVASFALNDMMVASPVKTGRYKASHRVAIGAADLSFEGEDYSGGGERGGGLSESDPRSQTILAAVWGDTIVISNTVPYAHRIEDGSSAQAPSGVYANTFERTLLFAETASKGNFSVS